MNLELTDEQQFLRDAARQALSRFKTVEGARDALEEGELPDLWPSAVEAGWPGLIVDDDKGGAGLGAFDAMLVLEECGKVLAGVPLIGHVAATEVLNASAGFDGLEAVAAGETRAALVAARPPDDAGGTWTVEQRKGMARVPAPSADGGSLSGEVAWVVDGAGADLLVVVAADGSAYAVEAGASGVTVEPVRRYDATRALAHVRFDGAAATPLEVSSDVSARAWFLAQALLAAESVGAVQTALEMSVAYAKERFTFGRAIGSYQAVKHGLVEILRRLENARSLLYYAGWAHESGHDEFPVAASAARSAAGAALDYGAREMIAVHGGIGATWEHDAPLFFRRAQLSRRLLGGDDDATERVALELLKGTPSKVS
jgi:alkylation response protein AidB-like acyl-CoA dehydrogenase